MVDKNVLSLPVLNQEGKYHGFIDMLDVVKYVMNCARLVYPLGYIITIPYLVH